MSAAMRPELSLKNKYWIERHRYYELKHFCLQYPDWKKAYLALDGMSKRLNDIGSVSGRYSNNDPTGRCAVARTFYSERIEMIEKVARNTDTELASYILEGVTKGVSYDCLKARLDIPCCKDTYYDRYRRFFYLLHKERQ